MDPRQQAGRLGCGGGQCARQGAVRGDSRLFRGFQDLRGGEQLRAVEAGNVAAGKQSDIDGGGGNGLRKIADNQNIVGIEGEKSGDNFSAERFDRGTHGFKAILGIVEQAIPSSGSETDLVAEIGHGLSFRGRGFRRFGDDALQRMRRQAESAQDL